MPTIEERVNEILLENGVYDADSAIQEKLLSEMNSLLFIQIVVAIENVFEIGIPDNYLLLSYFKSKESIVKIIQETLDAEIKNVNIVVDKGLCIGCLACIKLCPLGELQLSHTKQPYPVPIAPTNCNSCGNCLLECPAKADKL